MTVMKKLLLIIFSLLLSAGAAIAGNGKSNLREELSFAANGQDEDNILKTAKRIYTIPSKDYVCFWNGKKVKSPREKEFPELFSKEIVGKFFANGNCLQVASARRGFTLLDSPEIWSDDDIYRIIYKKPLIEGTKACIEVRLWSLFNSSSKQPASDVDGGVILHLKKCKTSWLIYNIEGTDQLGTKAFNILIEPEGWHPPAWRNVDYTESLTPH